MIEVTRLIPNTDLRTWLPEHARETAFFNPADVETLCSEHYEDYGTRQGARFFNAADAGTLYSEHYEDYGSRRGTRISFRSGKSWLVQEDVRSVHREILEQRNRDEGVRRSLDTRVGNIGRADS